MEKSIENGILSNRAIFENYIKKIKTIEDPSQRILMIKTAAAFATFRHTGYFSNNELESFLLDISEAIQFDSNNGAFEERSFLHVMTQCYDTGGHTRVVEKWIANAPQEEKHSVLLIDQGTTTIPDFLDKAIQKKMGRLIKLGEGSSLEKARQLYIIASSFEFIVLHIHFWDAIPLLAFGTAKFKRPIILFNHSDHVFWLGVAIADIVAEFRTSGKDLSLTRRGNRRSELLYLPLEEKTKVLDKAKSRILLGLPAEKEIILSIGGSFKYRPFGDYNFVAFALELLNDRSDAIFIVIGPNKKEAMWEDAYKRSKGRLNAIGTIRTEIIDDYRASADLYIESFPFGSAVALLDTGLLGIPALSLSAGMSTFDVAIQSGIQCASIKELIVRANQSLDNSPNPVFMQNIIDQHCGEGWKSQLRALIDNTPQIHSLNREFTPRALLDSYDEYLYQLTRFSYGDQYLINIGDYSRLSMKYKLFVINSIIHLHAFNIALIFHLLLNLIPYSLKKSLKKLISPKQRTRRAQSR